MSGKFIVGLLAFVMFTASIQAVAAPAEHMKEKMSAKEAPAEPMKLVEAVSKEFKEKDGKMDKVSYTTKKAMMDSLNLYTAKSGVVEGRSMARLLFSPEIPFGSRKTLMDKYEQLADLKLNGTPAEKEMATLKLQLLNSIGTYDNRDYAKAEFKDAFKATSVLLGLEGKQAEKAKPIMEKFVQSRAEGKDFVTSVDKAFAGKDGGYKKFTELCPG